jgi:hypothetical protein
MSDGVKQTPDSEYVRLGYEVHDWRHGDANVLVLQKEPFRIQWIASQLVTFVFLIPRNVQSYDEIIDDYRSLREYAGDHKRTWLPMGFQCGYALLPIYLGVRFNDALRASIRSTFKKRWCVFHVPSIFDLESRELTTLAANSVWGCIYRPFVTKTVAEVAGVLGKDGAQGWPRRADR